MDKSESRDLQRGGGTVTVGGWVLLVGSLTFVCGLAGWCYWKVLSKPEAKE